MKRARSLVISPAPYMFSAQSTSSLMWGMCVALAPPLCWGFWCFGASAALAVGSAIVAALAGEAAVGALSGRFTLADGSAFLTGLLVGLAMPAGVPLFVPVAASLFAVVLVKGAFGGLGSNWMNPALAGIAFALLNWPNEMGAWLMPRQLAGIGGVSGATPLGFVRDRIAASAAGSDPIGLLGAAGMRFSELDRNLTTSLNNSLFAPLGADLPPGYLDLFLGNKPGAIGEISAILILAASVILIARRMIRWEVPASMLGSYSLLVWVLGGLPFGGGFFSGDILFSLLTGSVLLIAFFMAPDPVTSPSSRPALVGYGAGIGLLTFLFRAGGSMAEGSAFAVLIMNCVMPAIARSGRRGAALMRRERGS